jgi:hypothetical protein
MITIYANLLLSDFFNCSYELNFRINVHFFHSKEIEKGVVRDFSVQVLQALSWLQTQNLNKSLRLL